MKRKTKILAGAVVCCLVAASCVYLFVLPRAGIALRVVFQETFLALGLGVKFQNPGTLTVREVRAKITVCDVSQNLTALTRFCNISALAPWHSNDARTYAFEFGGSGLSDYEITIDVQFSCKGKVFEKTFVFYREGSWEEGLIVTHFQSAYVVWFP
jgi:hypothetical protein